MSDEAVAETEATPMETAAETEAAPDADTGSRDRLLREHAEQRHRRDAAPIGSEAYQAAAIRIGEIEVEIARLERAAGVG
jgi:hypothetical protein